MSGGDGGFVRRVSKPAARSGAYSCRPKARLIWPGACIGPLRRPLPRRIWLGRSVTGTSLSTLFLISINCSDLTSRVRLYKVSRKRYCSRGVIGFLPIDASIFSISSSVVNLVFMASLFVSTCKLIARNESLAGIWVKSSTLRLSEIKRAASLCWNQNFH